MGGGSSVSPVLGFLALAAVVAAVVAFQRMMDAARRKATRGVMRGTHARGQTAVRTAVTFTAPTTVEATLEAIVAAVNPYASPPALVGGLYLKTRAADQAVLGFGSKVGDSFLVKVSLTASEDGARGRAIVPAWTESDGLVDAIQQIERVQARVEEAVGRLGGTTTRVRVDS